MPDVVVGGSLDRESNGANADGQQGLTDRLPQPDVAESVPARGGKNDQGKREAGADGGEVIQRHSHPHSDVKAEVVESGPSRDGDNNDRGQVECVYPPSVPRIGKPNGM